jgi:DNA (cytosine-5)-methyltransferase 1
MNSSEINNTASVNGELSKSEIYQMYFDKDIEKNGAKNTAEKESDVEFPFIDLFAGIGGIRLAFERVLKEKGKCVFSSEWDKNSQLTYIANFHERPHGDIVAQLAEDIKPHEILLAGFPLFCRRATN